ncbi:hypothetical protein [Streptomyces sp. NBC_01615]|uniref:hypothetical protein n=1 Tax=Streptomyces sp. NBC_01615 TaxID=2975898 RepID=UPI003863F9E6
MRRIPRLGATATGDTADWMDRDNATQRWLHRDRSHLQPDPRLRLERLRRNLMRTAAEGPGSTRTLRVITYTLIPPHGDSGPDHARLRAYAEGIWDVSHEIHDEALDAHRAPAPQHRNGWLTARLLLRQGAADGLIAISRDVISPDDALYEHELLWIGDHFSFVGLIIPESR